MTAVFKPLSIIIGLAAGQLSKALFIKLWGKVRNEEPPNPDQRDVFIGQLAVALVVEGAIARLVRGLADRGTRVAWHKRTGEWPGDPHQDKG
jgi:hypothetical protein